MHPITTERAPGRFALLQFEDDLHRLGPGLFDEGAGVDHDDIGLLGCLRQAVTGLEEHGDQLLRVDLVLGTSERAQPDSGTGHLLSL